MEGLLEAQLGSRATVNHNMIERGHTWAQWQYEVLQLLREELRDVMGQIDLDDVAWPLWEDFFAQGRTPRVAIDMAL